MFGLWLVGLHAAVLRVASGLTTRSACGPRAAVMALLFIGVPLAWDKSSRGCSPETAGLRNPDRAYDQSEL